MIDILTRLLPHVYASSPTAEEVDDAHQWAAEKSDVESPEPLYSFLYGGQSSSDLLKTWDLERTETELDEHRTQRTLTYTDSNTGLQVQCVMVIWKNYPTVEWTAYFKNNGNANTPILSSIQAIDTIFERSPDGDFIRHLSKMGP